MTSTIPTLQKVVILRVSHAYYHTPIWCAGRLKFLQGRWLNKDDFKDAVHRMGLVIGQSDNKKQRYRLRVKGMREKRQTLTTFRYYSNEMAIVRTSGHLRSIPVDQVLAKWEELVPFNSPSRSAPSDKRRPNVVWTHAAATKVLDMVDLTQTNSRYDYNFFTTFLFAHMCGVLQVHTVPDCRPTQQKRDGAPFQRPDRPRQGIYGG